MDIREIFDDVSKLVDVKFGEESGDRIRRLYQEEEKYLESLKDEALAESKEKAAERDDVDEISDEFPSLVPQYPWEE